MEESCYITVDHDWQAHILTARDAPRYLAHSLKYNYESIKCDPFRNASKSRCRVIHGITCKTRSQNYNQSRGDSLWTLGISVNKRKNSPRKIEYCKERAKRDPGQKVRQLFLSRRLITWNCNSTNRDGTEIPCKFRTWSIFHRLKNAPLTYGVKREDKRDDIRKDILHILHRLLILYNNIKTRISSVF